MRSPGMPRETRYVFTVTARRSPSAKLYSAVPRSSQCPSIVITHEGYLRNVAALLCTTAWASLSSSALSRPKKAGLNGEFRFRSSSERPPIESSPIGSGGTGRFSSPACVAGARAGGGAGVVTAGGVLTGGGAGRATGDCFLAHAATTRVNRIGATMAPLLGHCMLSSRIIPSDLLRPRGREVVPLACDLPHASA